MRVLMLDGGDRTPYLSRLVARLVGLGVEMHYAADPRWKDFDALAAAGVACHPIRIRHKLDFWARAKVRRILDEHKIDVLHTITGRDAYVGLRARGRRPVKTFVRRGAYPKLSRFDPADLLIYGPRGADRFLTVSRDLERHLLERGVAPERVTTVYTGIWSGELHPVARDLRKLHEVAPDALLLGLIGKLRPVKGFDYLLDALVLVRARGIGFHLIVAGEGYEAARKEIEGRELEPHVTLLGHLDDVMAVTPNVDCVVVPSRIDALPRAAIEATVLGTPVIGTRVGGIPEILDDGRAGVLVDPDDPGSLADALTEAAANPDALRRLAAAALARNREIFSIEHCANLHQQLYGAS